MKEGDCIEPFVLVVLQRKSARQLSQSEEYILTNRNIVSSDDGERLDFEMFR